jgi:glycosidase
LAGLSPLVYEINTRQWLYRLSEQSSHGITLANIPEPEFTEWARQGFTHIWLMGVWKCGPVIDTGHDHWRKLLPDFQPDDVVASPYAITDYTVDESLGGPSALRKFRERLDQHGLKLILDFVPNHTSRVHRWTRERPEFYVHSDTRRPETFRAGSRWIAHGKDPYFPAWIDTAQLDYRNPQGRATMIEELLKVSDQCDGVRCDMSMLLLNEVFEKTWKDFTCDYTQLPREFWQDAIGAVKKQHPGFVLLAEAYWDLEERLLALGFDFAYDKRVYDYLVARDAHGLRRHLSSKSAGFLNRATHFLENHDEERIASRLNVQEHRAAAVLTLALPGMRLLHEGQLTGARVRASVHLRRRAVEPDDADLTAFYETLLRALRQSAVGKGEFELIEGAAAEVFAVRWRLGPNGFDLAVVNYSATASAFEMGLGKDRWIIRDLIEPERTGTAVENYRATIEPFATRLLRFVKQP